MNNLQFYCSFVLLLMVLSCSKNSNLENDKTVQPVNPINVNLDSNEKKPDVPASLTILSSGTELRSSPNLLKDNIITKAAKGDRAGIIKISKKKDTIGKYGFDRWYEINYNNQLLWVFGGMTSLANDGHFAMKKIELPVSKPYRVLSKLVVEASTKKQVRKFYDTALYQPEEVTGLIKSISLKERLSLTNALDKIVSTLNHEDKEKRLFIDHINQINNRITTKNWDGWSSQEDSMRVALMMLLANDLSLALQNKVRWEKSFSYQFISRGLISKDKLIYSDWADFG